MLISPDLPGLINKLNSNAVYVPYSVDTSNRVNFSNHTTSVAFAASLLTGKVYTTEMMDQISGRQPGKGTEPVGQRRLELGLLGEGFGVELVESVDSRPAYTAEGTYEDAIRVFARAQNCTEDKIRQGLTQEQYNADHALAIKNLPAYRRYEDQGLYRHTIAEVTGELLISRLKADAVILTCIGGNTKPVMGCYSPSSKSQRDTGDYTIACLPPYGFGNPRQIKTTSVHRVLAETDTRMGITVITRPAEA